MIPKSRLDIGMPELTYALGSTTTRDDFEKAVAARAGARYGLAFTYAHSGFYALIKSLGLAGAEIVLPAYTCRVMADVVLRSGNVPVFVDVDLSDYNMNLAGLKQSISPRTRMIVATHMFGYPMSIRAVREIAGDGVIVIEDAALAFPGAAAEPDSVLSDASLFSFGPGKPLFTVRGGVLVTNNENLYEGILSFREAEMGELPITQWAKRWALLGIHLIRSIGIVASTTSQLRLSKSSLRNLVRPRRGGVDGYQSLTISDLPADYATRYTDFQARIGLAQLRKADKLLALRRAQAALYAEVLAGIPGLVPAPVVEGASYSLYSVRVRDRDAIGFRKRMMSYGVATGQVFNYALPSLPAYRPHGHGAYPNADRLSHEVVNLPSYPGLTKDRSLIIAQTARRAMGQGLGLVPAVHLPQGGLR